MPALSLNKPRIKAIYLSAIAVIILACWGNSAYIHGKALLAQKLIKISWQKTLLDQQKNYPWPWADTWPVAMLSFPKHGEKLYALSGAHGTSLAFGPGHIDGTALPGELGTKVFSAHRDTHFRFFKSIAKGERFSIQDMRGIVREYQIVKTQVVDTERNAWFINTQANEVHLITCYPFDQPSLNPKQRFIAIAEEIKTLSKP